MHSKQIERSCCEDFAWNRQNITEASTREFTLGRGNGELHEIAVDEKVVKKAIQTAIKVPFDYLRDGNGKHKQWNKMLCDGCHSTRLYSFTRIGSLEITFDIVAIRLFGFFRSVNYCLMNTTSAMLQSE